jgi:hypothetical protein
MISIARGSTFSTSAVGTQVVVTSRHFPSVSIARVATPCPTAHSKQSRSCRSATRVLAQSSAESPARFGRATNPSAQRSRSAAWKTIASDRRCSSSAGSRSFTRNTETARVPLGTSREEPSPAKSESGISRTDATSLPVSRTPDARRQRGSAAAEPRTAASSRSRKR